MVRLEIRRVATALALLCACGLSACAGDAPMAASAPIPQEAAAPYRLGMGDKVHIVVFGEENLSGDYTVAPDGNIVFPLTGGIHAAGLTIPQLQQAIVTDLGQGFVHDPHVTVDASSLRPFFILGEVNKPGQYSYLPDLTVLDAVATAQGFTYRADMSYVFIRHARQASEQEFPITPGTIIEPGDTIRVAQRYF
jgi:protein involved in polysaccharide export with SLBB domain